VWFHVLVACSDDPPSPHRGDAAPSHGTESTGVASPAPDSGDPPPGAIPFLFNGDRNDLSEPPEVDASCWGWQTTDNNQDGLWDYGRLQIRHPVSHVVTHDEHVGTRAAEDELDVATWSEDGQVLLSKTRWWDTYVYESRYAYDESARLVEIEFYSDSPLDLYAWEQYTYDEVGRLVDQRHEYEVGPLDFHTWEYDAEGKLAAIEQTSFLGVLRTEFAYDAAGTLISETTGPGLLPTATYEYPSDGVAIRRDWVDCENGSREVGRVSKHVRDRDGLPKRAMEVATDLPYPEVGLGCGHFNEQFTMEWEFEEQRLSGVAVSYLFVDDSSGKIYGGDPAHTTIAYDDSGNYVESTSEQWLGPYVVIDVGNQVWTWFCPGGAGLGIEGFSWLTQDRVCGEPAACP
jgi:hypothetical protein